VCGQQYLSAAHPHAEGQLEVFAAPHPQTLVERADLHEVVLVDGDGAADQRRTEERLASFDTVQLFVVRQLQPRVTANKQTNTVLFGNVQSELVTRHRYSDFDSTAVRLLMKAQGELSDDAV